MISRQLPGFFGPSPRQRPEVGRQRLFLYRPGVVQQVVHDKAQIPVVDAATHHPRLNRSTKHGGLNFFPLKVALADQQHALEQAHGIGGKICVDGGAQLEKTFLNVCSREFSGSAFNTFLHTIAVYVAHENRLVMGLIGRALIPRISVTS